MNWKEFKDTLKNDENLSLNFLYQGSDAVKGDYHITEIKQANITSVDCGGKINQWQEVILQLWEPPIGEEGQMTNIKARSIINKVEESISFHPESEVKIEFGNDLFAMRQMNIGSVQSNKGKLSVELLDQHPECKAIGRGETCGKPKVRMSELTESCCTPDSGCC